MDIPIQNIFYLLSYAWDQLDEAQTVDISPDECHSLDELFTRILINGTQHLLRRGLDQDYLVTTQELGTLRGSIQLSSSIAQQTWERGRMVCEFDELSHNVLHNQILKTTLEALLGANIPDILKSSLRTTLRRLPSIESVRISPDLFQRVRIHRNNRHYRFLLNVCELVHRTMLPTEQSGVTRFRDFTRDESQMNRLFEKFVRTFFEKHSSFEVSASHLFWNCEGSEEDLSLVPRMETDVSLIAPTRQIILDCKFYREAFSIHHDKKSFKRDHLFQIFAYLENAAHSKGWTAAEGILLYPAVKSNFHHRVTLNGHPITVSSVDLDKPWKKIHTRLLDIIS